MALLPSIYAKERDIILLLDDPLTDIENLQYYNICVKKKIRILLLNELEHLNEIKHTIEFVPWGWNRNIRRLLIDRLGPLSNIPSLHKISSLRELSHRRTTLKFFELIPDILDEEIEIPVEVFDTETAMALFRKNRAMYFKAPWSSSGRGVMLTDDLEEKHVLPWVKGKIRSQGSVIAEKAYSRTLDFATEWVCCNGHAQFLGLSVFNASRRGKYLSNMAQSQTELYKMISKFAPKFSNDLIDRQRSSLEILIAKEYDGPVGIDMLATKSGAINPCVEINLRHTMGMINLIRK